MTRRTIRFLSAALLTFAAAAPAMLARSAATCG
jgi:hypothetical protein